MRRVLAAVFALAIPSSGIAAELAFLADSSRAMACCVAAKGQCRGWKTPHECCGTRDSTAVSIAPAPIGASRDLAVPSAACLQVESPVAALPLPVLHDGSLTFKRPHDPPHLHTFNLLI